MPKKDTATSGDSTLFDFPVHTNKGLAGVAWIEQDTFAARKFCDFDELISSGKSVAASLVIRIQDQVAVLTKGR